MRLVSVMLFALAGCGSGEASLVVQVRTDLLPNVELGAVVVEFEGAETRREANDDVDWGRGVRVVELGPLALGEHSLIVRALAPNGDFVVERPVRVTLDGGVHVVTVLLTRDCAGVTCPAADAAATACLGGRCVPEGCTEETPELCPIRECESESDCPERAAACAVVRCTLSGSCYAEPNHGACDPGFVCSVDDGCASDCDRVGDPPLEASYGEGLGGLRDVTVLSGGSVAAVGSALAGDGSSSEGVIVDLGDVTGAISTIGQFPGVSLEAITNNGPDYVVVAGPDSAAEASCSLHFRDLTGAMDLGNPSFRGPPACSVEDMLGRPGIGPLIAGALGDSAALIRSTDGPASITAVSSSADEMREFHALARAGFGFAAAGIYAHETGQSIFVRTYDATLSSPIEPPGTTTPSWPALRVVGVREAPDGFEVYGTVSDDRSSWRRMRIPLTIDLTPGEPVETGENVEVADIAFLADGGYALAETRTVGTTDTLWVSRWDASHRLLWSERATSAMPTRAAAIVVYQTYELVVVGSTGAGGDQFFAMRIADRVCGL